MDSNRKRRQSSSSHASLERDYPSNTFDRNQRSLERRRSATWSSSDNPIKNSQPTRRQESISPSRNKRDNSSYEARKSFSSRHSEVGSSSSRRDRSPPFSLDVSIKTEGNLSPELCKREWLPSAKYEDNHSLGYAKTRPARYDSSSSDFDTPVKKNATTKREKQSFSPQRKSRSHLSEHREHISSRKNEHSSVYKNDPEFMSQTDTSYSSVSGNESSVKNTRKESNDRRSSSSTCSASSPEMRSPSPYRSASCSTLLSRQSPGKNKQRPRSSPSSEKDTLSRPSEKTRSSRSSEGKCSLTEKKRRSGYKPTATSSSTKENSPSLSWSDGQSPASDKQPRPETDLSTSIRRIKSPPVSTDSCSTFEHSDKHTRKRQSRKGKWNSRSSSVSVRDSTLKGKKEQGDWTWPLVYKSKSRSASPSDKDRPNRATIDTKDGRSNDSNRIIKLKDDAVKSQGNISYAPPTGSKRDTDYMKIEVIVKRRRSSETPSSNNATDEYTDTGDAEHTRKRRRLNEFDSCNQTDLDKVSMKSTVRSIAVRPKSSPQNFHRDVNPVDDYEFVAGGHSSNKRRSFHDNLVLQNCCPYSDETGDNFGERPGTYDSKSYSPASGRMNSFGSASGHSNISPLSRTPQRSSSQRFEGSPRFSSPSFISNLSPRSTLRGLDQPHPWALDLTARSRTYSGNFIDSHCHIDLIYDRLGLSHGTTFSEFRRMVAHSFPDNFEGCVAVFCYPKTYDPNNPQDQLFTTLGHDDGIWFAIGCHPKSATEFTARHEQGLRKALRQSKVVALGEIGLDYSGTFHRHAETQKKVLRKQLEMAMEMKLPLVLHCRDAYDDCLAILMKIVPRSWPIHLHCFCGNPDTANVWLQTYPNLYIGLTPVITYKTAHDAINTARNIPLSRLLLETDSPYFVPGHVPKGRSSMSHPGFALFTAERIAELKNVSVDTVLEACRANTYNVYGI